MKRLNAIGLVLVVVLAALSGCNATANETVDTGKSISESSQSVEVTPVSSEEPENSLPNDDTAEEEIPSYEWEFDVPENHGMDADLLQQLHSTLNGSQMLSFVTVKDGYIVDEYYQDGYDETSVFTFQSGSKSFTGALVGIAIDEGYIEGLDVSITEYFPQVAGTDKEAITIRHLLEHTSGIQWFEWGSNAASWEPWINSENWVDYVLAQPVVTTPGTTFNYSTGGVHLLSAILEQATGESLMEYGKRHIFEPLRMDSVVWDTDPQGIADGGNGINMTARDAAKFGQLYLDGGNWNGLQLIPATWVEQSIRQQSAGSGSAGVYGYQWWIRQFGQQGYDTYYAMGYAGQYILVVPELQLVTVITSTLNQGSYTPWPYFSDYVVDACF